MTHSIQSDQPRPPFKARGVYPALVTPFTGDDEIDEEAYRRLIRYVLPHVDGLVPCGTTGEFPSLTPEEQERLVHICVEEAQGKPVIAGTGAEGTRKVIELAERAQDAGASVCLVVTPYFLHPSDKGIYQHFLDVTRAIDIPVIMYNIPQMVDAVLPRRVVEDLADLPQIIGLKDSSGNIPYTMEVLEYVGERLPVLIGHDEVALNGLAGGASGLILASANVYPELWQEVLKAVHSGALEKARSLQRRVQKINRIFCRMGGGVAVKQALKLMGLDMGPPRGPMMAVGGVIIHEDRAELELELERIGKISPRDEGPLTPRPPLNKRFEEVGLSHENIQKEGLKVSAAEAGDELEKVGLDIVRGSKGGALGEAWAYQLTYPRQRYEALTTILEPNLTVRPSTLLVPTLPQRTLRQANMIYGPIQAAVGRAIVDKVAEGKISERALDEELMIVMVTLHPRAMERRLVFQNALQAMTSALELSYSKGGQS
jgi:4-hydroxy-tetrahydrodipicolinate synthase